MDFVVCSPQEAVNESNYLSIQVGGFTKILIKFGLNKTTLTRIVHWNFCTNLFDGRRLSNLGKKNIRKNMYY